MESVKVGIRAVAEFTKTTLIGGILVVIPVYLSILLLLKLFKGMVALVAPVTHGLPVTLPFREAVALLVMVALCLFCGIAVRTRPGLWMKNVLENTFLEKIPGYSLIRGVTGRLAGKSDEQTFTVVLAEIEDALVPAFLVEECDADHCAIFVPSVPTPAAGAIYIIAKSRIHRVDVPLTQALGVISKWGAGSRELFAKMEMPGISSDMGSTRQCPSL